MVKAESPSSYPEELPLFVLDDQVAFPQSVLSLSVTDEANVELVREAVAGDQLLALFAPRDEPHSNLSKPDLYDAGCIGQVLQAEPTAYGALNVVVEGLSRCRLVDFMQQQPYPVAQVEALADVAGDEALLAPLNATVRSQLERALELSDLQISLDMAQLNDVSDPGALADLIADALPLSIEEKQRLLATVEHTARLELLAALLTRHIEASEHTGDDDNEQELNKVIEQIQREMAQEKNKTDGADKNLAEAIDRIQQDYTDKAPADPDDVTEAAVHGFCELSEDETDASHRARPDRDTLEPAVLEDVIDQASVPGTAIGVAGSSPYLVVIEAVHVDGKGELTVVGHSGGPAVMAAQVAMVYLKTHADELGITSFDFGEHDIYVNVPEEVAPADMPGAGLPIVLAIASAIIAEPCLQGLAAIGTPTLTGAVLAARGLRARVQTAIATGVSQVIIPARGAGMVRDLLEREHPETHLRPVHSMEEALIIALGSEEG